MVHCDLLDFAGIMRNRLAKLFREKDASVEEMEQQMRAFEQYLKITKQVERLAQIRLKSEQLRADGEARKEEIQKALESEKSTK